MTTYGTLAVCAVPGGVGWRIDAEPHVVARAKRILPRVNVHRRGSVIVKHTPEVAVDLEWLMLRWPLAMTDDDRARLEAEAARHRESLSTVNAILAGYVPPDRWRDFAVPPRGYQTVAGALAHETGRLLLCDDLGLGKSCSSLLVLRDPDALPALVVTLAHLTHQWAAEVTKFMPWLSPHILRNGDVYDPLRADERLALTRTRSAADVVVCNYHKLDKWAPYLRGKVNTVIFDEMQELRRHQSLKYAAAASIADAARWVVGATATPVYNYGDEIYNVVSILDDDVLGTRDEFRREWCMGDRVSDPAALGTYLRDQGVMLRRTRSDVGRELPEVVRVPHQIDLDAATLDRLTSDAVDLARRIVDATGSNFDLMKASGDLDWRLRHATGIAKAAFVADFVRMVAESGEPVVVYLWHRDVYTIVLERLADLRPAMFTGSESPARKVAEADRFKNGDTDVMLMSLRSGAGLDGLQDRSSVCVFGELDWSPGVHSQCIGRLHRDGQTDPVVAYFLVAESGADPVIADVLELKRQQSEPLVDPDRDILEAAPDVSGRVRRLAEDFLARRGG